MIVTLWFAYVCTYKVLGRRATKKELSVCGACL